MEPRDEVMISAKRHEAQSPAGPGGVTAMDDPISAQIIHDVAAGAFPGETAAPADGRLSTSERSQEVQQVLLLSLAEQQIVPYDAVRLRA